MHVLCAWLTTWATSYLDPVRLTVWINVVCGGKLKKTWDAGWNSMLMMAGTDLATSRGGWIQWSDRLHTLRYDSFGVLINCKGQNTNKHTYTHKYILYKPNWQTKQRRKQNRTCFKVTKHSNTRKNNTRTKKTSWTTQSKARQNYNKPSKATHQQIQYHRFQVASGFAPSVNRSCTVLIRDLFTA